jgi:hypothetical protein
LASAKSSPAILNSWKEIAQYLDRGVRTVQRWERDLQLPVHRIGKGKRSPVFAQVPELKFWLSTSGATSLPREAQELARQKSDNGQAKNSPLNMSHELIKKSTELVRTVAAASIRQQRQAEILQKRIIEIRSRIH